MRKFSMYYIQEGASLMAQTVKSIIIMYRASQRCSQMFLHKKNHQENDVTDMFQFRTHYSSRTYLNVFYVIN